MDVLLPLLKKYWSSILLLFVIVFLLHLIRESNHEIKHLESSIETERLERSLAQTVAEKNLLQVQNKYSNLAKEREEEYAQKYQELLDTYSTLDKSINSLSNTTKTIRDTIRSPNTTTETRIEYIDRYETAFSSCIGEYSGLAKRFDEADHKTKQLDEYVDSLHEQIAEFNNLYKTD